MNDCQTEKLLCVLPYSDQIPRYIRCYLIFMAEDIWGSPWSGSRPPVLLNRSIGGIIDPQILAFFIDSGQSYRSTGILDLILIFGNIFCSPSFDVSSGNIQFSYFTCPGIPFLSGARSTCKVVFVKFLRNITVDFNRKSLSKLLISK